MSTRESIQVLDPVVAPKALTIDVLVADDSNPFRTSLCSVIESACYSTVQAADGKEAFELLETLRIRSMVLDVQMPNLDGLSLLDKFDHPPPVVLLTGSPFGDDIRTRADKVVWYLQKPVDPEELLRALISILGASVSVPSREIPSNELHIGARVELRRPSGAWCSGFEILAFSNDGWIIRQTDNGHVFPDLVPTRLLRTLG